MRRTGFTLIELLLVVAILAVIAVTLVTVLNPSQLLKQARDSDRASNLVAMSKAFALYQASLSSASMGSSSVVYVSVPDSSSTCGNLGLPDLPGGYSYACKATSTYRNVDGTGWLPINFTALSSGAPFESLPIDPVNTAASGLYYAYAASGATYALSAAAESSKYLASVAATDGGVATDRQERGSDYTLLSGVAYGSAGPTVSYPIAWTITDGLASGNTKNDSTGALSINASFHWLTKSYTPQQPTGVKRRLTFTPTPSGNNYGMWGVDYDNGEECSNTVNFAWSRKSGETWKVLEGGVQKYDTGSTAIQEMAVEVTAGGAVRYYRNGSLVYTSATSISGPYYFIVESGYYIHDCTFTSGTAVYGTATAGATTTEN